MSVQIDESVGAAYITFVPVADGGVARSISTDDAAALAELPGDVVFDIDARGYVVGIEIPAMRQVLPPEFEDAAESDA